MHILMEEPFRGNYAGKGYRYDADNDVFIAPDPSFDDFNYT